MEIQRSNLTVMEAAHLLNISIDTIRRWEKKGLVRAQRSIQNHRLFHLDELKRLLQKHSGSHAENRYRVLKSEKQTSFTAIELFSGAGGLALGLENAGIRSKMLVEFDKDAVATLKENRPKWNVVHDDIRKVDFSEYADRIDIVAGGFPCQAFSYAGHGLGFGDVRGTLFFEFARCVQQVQPKIAIAENVRGLLRHDGGRTLDTMIQHLGSLGYRVEFKLLRAQFLDVPQKRERLLILAVRKDLDVPFLIPRERDYTISIREAFEANGGVPKSDGAKYPKGKKEILALVPPGGYWKDLPEDIQKRYLGGSFHLSGGKTGMARRLSWDEPSLTLTCSPAQKQTERCHPQETRPLTIREYARIQTFPDDWYFCGSQASQYKQIGNAVPVNLGYYIGRALIGILHQRSNDPDLQPIEPVIDEARKWRLFT